MEKITMVEKKEYFCDICGKNMTDASRYTCGVCGRHVCNACYISVRGWKELWLTVCDICEPMYKEIKKQMNIDSKKHEALHLAYCTKLYEEWKRKSLLVEDATRTIDENEDEDDIC